jgi:hypothetical protein
VDGLQVGCGSRDKPAGTNCKRQAAAGTRHMSDLAGRCSTVEGLREPGALWHLAAPACVHVITTHIPGCPRPRDGRSSQRDRRPGWCKLLDPAGSFDPGVKALTPALTFPAAAVTALVALSGFGCWFPSKLLPAATCLPTYLPANNTSCYSYGPYTAAPSICSQFLMYAGAARGGLLC